MKRIALVVCLMLCAGTAGIHVAAADLAIKTLITRDLAGLQGKELTMITLDYPPGWADPVHTHDAQAIVYVLEGSIVMQVKGGKPVTLKPGEVFYEGPDDVHVVGRNASKTAPAKLLVVLVKGKGTPILTPVQ